VNNRLFDCWVVVIIGQVIVEGASNLTDGHEGGTKVKVNALLQRCAGKVLIVDEAYQLGESKYGREALDVFVERMQVPSANPAS
jgi:hypothetical protein